jgi:hypothetical protein
MMVQDKKKAKEVAACEVNLSMFTVKKEVPYGAKVRVEWTSKVPKGFETQMDKAPAVLLIYIHIGASGNQSPKAKPQIEAKKQVEKQSEEEENDSSNPFGKSAPKEAKSNNGNLFFFFF